MDSLLKPLYSSHNEAVRNHAFLRIARLTTYLGLPICFRLKSALSTLDSDVIIFESKIIKTHMRDSTF